MIGILIVSANDTDECLDDRTLSTEKSFQYFNVFILDFIVPPEQRSLWPRGKVLGGSSAINANLYVRGNKHDYDRWAREGGASGWSWEEVLPYFLKAEDQQNRLLLANGLHATGGPLTVAHPSWLSPIGKTFLQTAKYLGYFVNGDVNGPLQSGFAVPQGTTRKGARCSTAKAYLKPIRLRSNLHVVTFAHVTRVLFSGKRAVGVQFSRFSLSHLVYARREVILSAGAIGSPQLLMLSGVGPRWHLKQVGIPVISDLPVGENLQDHIYAGGLHFAVRQPVTITQERAFNAANIAKYFTSGSGEFGNISFP